MPLELKKVTPTRLRLLGLDERWLQVRIEEDPSLTRIGRYQRRSAGEVATERRSSRFPDV